MVGRLLVLMRNPLLFYWTVILSKCLLNNCFKTVVQHSYLVKRLLTIRKWLMQKLSWSKCWEEVTARVQLQAGHLCQSSSPHVSSNRGQKGCKSQRMEGTAVKCCLLYMEYLLHTWAHSNCGYLPIIAKGLTSYNSGTDEKGYWGPSLRWGAIGRQWQQWGWETNTVLEIWSLAESFSFFRLLKLIIQSYSRIWNSCSISLFTYVPSAVDWWNAGSEEKQWIWLGRSP